MFKSKIKYCVILSLKLKLKYFEIISSSASILLLGLTDASVDIKKWVLNVHYTCIYLTHIHSTQITHHFP